MIETFLQFITDVWNVFAQSVYNIALFFFGIVLWVVELFIDAFVVPLGWALEFFVDMGASLFIWCLGLLPEIDVNTMVDSAGYTIFQQSCGVISHLINVPVVITTMGICFLILSSVSIIKFCIKLIPTVG